jgi:CotH protein/lamin tail-like protein
MAAIMLFKSLSLRRLLVPAVALVLALMATAFVTVLPTARAAPAAGAAVVLNEINCEATDWVELINTSDSPADLSGWLLTDDPLDRVPLRADHRYLFPAATTIPPGDDLVVEKVAGGFPFGISCGSDTIRLADGAAGSLVDEFTVPLLAAAGDTWGRFPDGTGSWVETAPTEGAVNEPSSAGGGPPPDPSWLFDPGAVPVIDLTLPQATIDALDADPTTAYHDATFSLTRAGGQTYGPLAVGVRLKGGIGSFRTLYGKAAFKLKFNYSVAGQRFQGLKKLTLNNMVQDKSMIHETLAYAAFRAVGVPAPRTGYAYVRVNGGDFGLYLDVETLDDVALKRLFATTQHLYEGEYTDDVSPGGASSFGVDEGSGTDLADLDALIAAVNGDGPWSEQVGPLADLTEMTREWAVERYIGHWDSYSGWLSPSYSPNNYFLHNDASGRFRMLPWGTDQTWADRLGFDTGHAIMFTKCLADATCAALYRDAVDAAASTIGAFGLDALADATATALAPWQELDPRREETLAEIDAGVAATHEFLRVRPGDAAAWLALAPVVTGVPDREPNPAGWYQAAVTIDWQATDDSGSATDPSDMVASTEGSNVAYESEPSCDPYENCATGSLALSIDSVGPSLAPTISPATILLHATATTTPHATDATSGVSSQSCGSPDTSSAGAHTLTCTATDNAGNSTTVSVAYVVQYKILGFFSPAPNSKWKRGQTAPIKIALGDVNGNRISDSEAQGLLSPTSRVMFVATGAQSASACMKYDTANHQLIYNWKLGQPIGSVTISTQVGYAGTTTKTVLSEPVTITR